MGKPIPVERVKRPQRRRFRKTGSRVKRRGKVEGRMGHFDITLQRGPRGLAAVGRGEDCH